MIFKKMMITDDRSDLCHLSFFGDRNILLSFSESGDTYTIDEIPDNAYGYGDLAVYASVLDGLGWRWAIDPLVLRLEKSSSVIDYDSDSGYSVISEGNFHSATGKLVGRATYISDVLSVGNDFGFWKSISWTQLVHGERVVVAVKAGKTPEEVVSKDWERYFEVPTSYYDYPSGSTFAEIDLDRFNLSGSHFMFKVEMETRVSSSRPSVRDLRVAYAGKHSVLFFTNRIRIEASGFDNMILTASSTVPARTELSFAVGPGDSVDWADYRAIDLGEIANVPNSFGSRMRVGIRLASFDSVKYPTVHEFALEFSSDDDATVNLEGLS